MTAMTSTDHELVLTRFIPVPRNETLPRLDRSGADEAMVRSCTLDDVRC
jgi:hypothetical protein